MYQNLDPQVVAVMLELAKSGHTDAVMQFLGKDVVTRQKQLTTHTLYGGGGLFSVCASDNLVNASMNDQGFAAAIPWRPTTFNVRRQAAISAIGDLVGGTQPTDQCATPPGVDWRGCEIEWCLGRIRYRSPEYDRLDQGERWCDKVPRYRIFGNITVGGATIAPQGSVIDNDAEWGAVQAAVGIRQTLGRWLYTGNRATSPHMFDGLQVLVNNGYVDLASQIACEALDSDVKDYESDCIGDPTSTKNIYRYLQAIFGRIEDRAVGAGLDMPNPSDQLIVGRPEVIDALYEYWACNIGPCATGIGAAGQIQFVNADYARSTADDLRRRSVLRVNGRDIPVLRDGYQPFTNGAAGARISDVYVLTQRIAGMQIIFGEFKDFRAGVGDALTGWASELYGGKVVDDGRFYVWQERENTCFDTRVALKPSLVILLPFLQGRLTNVCAQPLQAPLSPYPPDGSPYYPDGGAYDAWYGIGDCGPGGALA